jgi:hypothetical protein
MIPDRFFFPLMALVVAALIGLALVFPQGEGERSPAPFGHDQPPPPAAVLPAVR